MMPVAQRPPNCPNTDSRAPVSNKNRPTDRSRDTSKQATQTVEKRSADRDKRNGGWRSHDEIHVPSWIPAGAASHEPAMKTATAEPPMKTATAELAAVRARLRRG